MMEHALIGVAAFLWVGAIVVLLRLFKCTDGDDDSVQIPNGDGISK